MPRLHLALLGAPRASLDGRDVSLPTRKALALLIYLAAGGGAHTRAHLAALLWPDSDPAHARLSLRRALGQLRDALGDAAGPLLLADSESVRLAPGAAALDTDLLRDLPAAPDQRAAAEAALAAYRGDFLEGFAVPDAPELEAWAAVQRERWHRQLSRAMDRLSALALAGGDLRLAVDVAARWAAHDPLDEAAHRRLIEAHAASGSRTLAAQAYAALADLLARELGAAPAPETAALLERVRAAAPPSIARGAPAGRAPQLLEPPMVGRAAELGRLIEAFHHARAGGALVASVEGEAGIGKTRLADELASWAAAAGADVLRGRAFEAGGRVPYQPLVDSLRPRVERENAPDDLLDDVWLAELALLLPELRSRYPDLPTPASDEATARVRLLESAVALLAALGARAPVVLILDDAQWADAASLDLLRYAVRRLAEQRAALLVVCTVRAEDLAANAALTAWMAGLERDGALRRVALAALSEDDTRGLLAALAPEGQAAGLARWLYGETGGQPLYMVETLKVLLDRGVLAAAGAGLRLADGLADVSALRGIVPPTVRAVIRARLSQISHGAQALLAAAAVLGHAAPFERLCRVAGLAEEAGLGALDELLGRRLLVEQPPAGYALTHDKVRDVAYTEAGEARRRVYHRRALAALEGATAAELAHHALAGGLAAEAFAHSAAAGDDALRLFAVEDAAAAYEQARALIDPRGEGLGVAAGPAEALRLFLQLGRAHELRSDLERARAVYQELLGLARGRGWAEAACAALNRLATLLVQQRLDMDEAVGLLREAQALARDAGSAAALAETEWNLAQHFFYAARPELTRAHGGAALRLAREHGMPELAARSLNVLAMAATALAACDEAAGFAREAAAAYAAIGDRALQADSMALGASALINRGRVAEGLALAGEALQISRAIGNVWGIVTCAMTAAGGLCDAGRLGEALASAGEAVRLARGRPLGMILALALGVLGAAQRAALQLDAARATHREALELVRPTGARLLVDMAASELCADCALAGDMAEAAGHAREALGARDDIFTLFMGRAQAAQARALAWAGEAARAAEDLRRFEERVGDQGRYRVGALQARAQLALAAGDAEEAALLLGRALDAAEALDLPVERWQILTALAAAHRARGADDMAEAAGAAAAEVARRLAATLDTEGERAAFLAAAAAVVS